MNEVMPDNIINMMNENKSLAYHYGRMVDAFIELVSEVAELKNAFDTDQKAIEDNKILRELLRIEHALTTKKWESPWKCEESGCPYFGKPVDRRSCKCYEEKQREHVRKVREALGNS